MVQEASAANVKGSLRTTTFKLKFISQSILLSLSSTWVSAGVVLLNVTAATEMASIIE